MAGFILSCCFSVLRNKTTDDFAQNPVGKIGQKLIRRYLRIHDVTHEKCSVRFLLMTQECRNVSFFFFFVWTFPHHRFFGRMTAKLWTFFFFSGQNTDSFVCSLTLPDPFLSTRRNSLLCFLRSRHYFLFLNRSPTTDPHHFLFFSNEKFNAPPLERPLVKKKLPHWNDPTVTSFSRFNPCVSHAEHIHSFRVSEKVTFVQCLTLYAASKSQFNSVKTFLAVLGSVLMRRFSRTLRDRCRSRFGIRLAPKWNMKHNAHFNFYLAHSLEFVFGSSAQSCSFTQPRFGATTFAWPSCHQMGMSVASINTTNQVQGTDHEFGSVTLGQRHCFFSPSFPLWAKKAHTYLSSWFASAVLSTLLEASIPVCANDSVVQSGAVDVSHGGLRILPRVVPVGNHAHVFTIQSHEKQNSETQLNIQIRQDFFAHTSIAFSFCWTKMVLDGSLSGKLNLTGNLQQLFLCTFDSRD